MNKKRIQDERKYGNWEELPKGSRRYWFDVFGRDKGIARYCKEVDEDDNIVKFWQEIYNEDGKMIEIHEKYPVDKGHKKLF